MVNADEYPASSSRPRHVGAEREALAHVATAAAGWHDGPRTGAVACRAERWRGGHDATPKVACFAAVGAEDFYQPCGSPLYRCFAASQELLI